MVTKEQEINALKVKALLRSENEGYKVELENGSAYWSMPDERRANFLKRVRESIKSDLKIKPEILDFTAFAEARGEAIHQIAFIDYELGRMGHELGSKPVRKEALKRIVEIIYLYNEGKYELIINNQ
jgi:hypothetical protein